MFDSAHALGVEAALSGAADEERDGGGEEAAIKQSLGKYGAAGASQKAFLRAATMK